MSFPSENVEVELANTILSRQLCLIFNYRGTLLYSEVTVELFVKLRLEKKWEESKLFAGHSKRYAKMWLVEKKNIFRTHLVL